MWIAPGRTWRWRSSKACYGLMWAERYRTLVAETQEQRKLHAEMARARFKNGVATEVDVLRSEVAVANGAPDLVRADNAIRQARALVNFYLVRPLDSPRSRGRFPGQALGPVGSGGADPGGRAPAARTAAAGIAESSAESSSIGQGGEPHDERTSTAAYGISRASREFNPLYARWNLGVSFTLPVFDGFKRSGLVYQATANQRAARLEREKVEQQVRLGLQQGLDEIKAATETIAAARANIEQAEKVLPMTQNNYKYGAATTLDIVDAQTALSMARNNLLRGLYDYSVARANLLWTAGRAHGSSKHGRTADCSHRAAGRGSTAAGRMPEEGNPGRGAGRGAGRPGQGHRGAVRAFPLTVAVTGTLVSNTRVDVKAETIGRLVKFPKQEGDSVAAGEAVAWVDQENYQLAVRQAETAVQVAEARWRRPA